MRRLNVLIQVSVDHILLLFSYWFALLIRFEGNIPAQALKRYLVYFEIAIIVKLALLLLFDIYRILWRYAGAREYLRILFATFISNALITVVLLAMNLGIPRSIFPLVLIFDVFLLSFPRLSPRIYQEIRFLRLGGKRKRVMILGAGEAGVMVLKELRRMKGQAYDPVCFIDDDRSKWGRMVNGLRVVGGRQDIRLNVSKYGIDEIIFAIPSLPLPDKREYIKHASQSKAEVKTIPGIFELIEEKVSISELRHVDITDLLGRDPVILDTSSLKSFLSGKRILITGAGGSIGSELVRQILEFYPGELILLDIYENNLYDLEMDIKRNWPYAPIRIVIDSVRSSERMSLQMERLKPEIVFHAAAHKHVPLMETNPQAAVLNNVFGTYNVAKAAHENKVEKFIFISTDKAVNPTNIMGATKRLGEMIVQAFNGVSATEYGAVRFGNVLGSSGSVIPLFQKQIAEGGPVTVTHKDITRYFMTIPEAAQLVLQAGSYAKGGEIFVLDMGKPVKIADLARDLIRLSGFHADKDIMITYTGLRPGEKLYEELLLDKTRAKETRHKKIFIEPSEHFSLEEMEVKLETLMKTVRSNNRRALYEYMMELVPSFHPKEYVHDYECPSKDQSISCH